MHMHEEPLRGLYVITDPYLLERVGLINGVEQAIVGGAKLVQYRNKLAAEPERLSEARSLRALCAERDVRFVVNDDVELCRRINADGVHLGKTDGTVKHARKLLGTEPIVGVTCHDDLEYAARAHREGASYCAFGRIFPSKTKPQAPGCALDVLRLASGQAYSTVAIGGISIENGAPLLDMGVDLLAVIHGVFGQTDIQASAQKFSSLF